jgi:Na+/H+ antiporter NhaB
LRPSTAPSLTPVDDLGFLAALVAVIAAIISGLVGFLAVIFGIAGSRDSSDLAAEVDSTLDRLKP